MFLELFQFVFSSFWVWLGILLLITAATTGFSAFVRSIRG